MWNGILFKAVVKNVERFVKAPAVWNESKLTLEISALGFQVSTN